MARNEIAVKKYIVRLSSEERQQLEALIRKGKGPAQRLLKARICWRLAEAGATAGSLPPWTPARPWSIACVSNWWKKASRRF